MIRYGPAGFQYKDWEGVVYPAPRPKGFDPLAYLAGYFDTIEINSTFYGPATPKPVQSWLQRVEHNPDFRFAMKLYQRFTHQRRTAWTKAEVQRCARGSTPCWRAAGWARCCCSSRGAFSAPTRTASG